MASILALNGCPGLVDHYKIDRWREKAAAQAQVKAEIIKHLWDSLPLTAYDPEEIDLKANAVFSHIYSSGMGDEPRVYH